MENVRVHYLLVSDKKINLKLIIQFLYESTLRFDFFFFFVTKNVRKHDPSSIEPENLSTNEYN